MKYGGLQGEHGGKGVRSQHREKFFTPELWQELRYEILFDPNANRLNPGKICTPILYNSAMWSSIRSSR